jgi:carbamoylphosphate synthase large subunit
MPDQRELVVKDFVSARQFVIEVGGFPVRVFSVYSLNWSEIVRNEEQLSDAVRKGLELSPIEEVLIRELPISSNGHST